ncbi:MAG: recombination protein RecR [Candidatus Vogelbacteria bacterium CG10_big_fil_rev_8_21_14_0_10_49_38]|uniref:Recombination protein RecR n=1 Tax=Candidatus Vogelbacteria bacterium CG10_big_fil_rev_8_21_14_0_10_49_38 TaxID=1975043 RepID=A0A2H0RJ66_9BACT|nr:MAG: hypothetical protein BK006_02940 [bacterium CG10_49_38]PIR45825.1 MAG: recombination protein RecR [Candidatus Vogelbacteria bacterium CG10_big_fil_rev_8_21_14_0_10_49_38]
MDTHPINSLTDLFKKFPGIGPRQAKRFVYHLLGAEQIYLDQLAEKIARIKKEIKQCQHCGRYFGNGYRPDSLRCKLCADESRDQSTLMIVEKDIDLEAVERANSYRGYYFVLGGTVPILDPNPAEHLRFNALLIELKRRQALGLKEVILALSATAEGDHTADWLVAQLSPLTTKMSFEISFLGRGLSTGSELEYADPDTIKNALASRH